ARVSIRTAVCTVMCRLPMIRAPASGWLPAYSCRSAISPGISYSARRISLRPNSASERSFTLKGSRPASRVAWKGCSCATLVAMVSVLVVVREFRRGRTPRSCPDGDGGEEHRALGAGVQRYRVIRRQPEPRPGTPLRELRLAHPLPEVAEGLAILRPLMRHQVGQQQPPAGPEHPR